MVLRCNKANQLGALVAKDGALVEEVLVRLMDLARRPDLDLDGLVEVVVQHVDGSQ